MKNRSLDSCSFFRHLPVPLKPFWSLPVSVSAAAASEATSDQSRKGGKNKGRRVKGGKKEETGGGEGEGIENSSE